MTDSRAVFGIYERGREGRNTYVDGPAYPDASIDEKERLEKGGRGDMFNPEKDYFARYVQELGEHARICQM